MTYLKQVPTPALRKLDHPIAMQCNQLCQAGQEGRKSFEHILLYSFEFIYKYMYAIISICIYFCLFILYYNILNKQHIVIVISRIVESTLKSIDNYL